MEVRLIISLILNILLVVLFLFKNALNKIVKEWWSDRKKKTEENRNRLIELRRNIFIFPKLAMINFLQFSATHSGNSDYINGFSTIFKNNNDKIGDCIRRIYDNEMFYPDDIKQKVRKMHSTLKEYNALILDRGVTAKMILDMSQTIEGLADEINERIDSII